MSKIFFIIVLFCILAQLVFSQTLQFDIGYGKNIGYDDSIDLQSSLIFENSFKFLNIKVEIQYFDGCLNITGNPEVFITLFDTTPSNIYMSIGSIYHIGFYSSYGLSQDILVSATINTTLKPTQTTLKTQATKELLTGF